MRHERLERVADAERLESGEQWLQAAEIWAKLAEEDGDARTMVRHARALKHAGKFAEAESVLGRALMLAPGVSSVHFALGLLFEEQDRLEDARRAFEQGLCLDEESVFLTLLGSVQRRLGDLTAAERTFRRSLDLDSTNDEAHYGLGLVLKDSNPLEAVEHIQQAISIDPSLDKAHRELGHALWRAGRLSEALDAFREAIARDPDDAWAHDYLGHLLQHQGDWLAAKDEFAAATKAQPRTSFFWCNLADAHAGLGDRRHADRYFRRALSLGMGLPVIERRYGIFLKSCGQPAKAEKYLQRALDQDPSDEEARASLAELR